MSEVWRAVSGRLWSEVTKLQGSQTPAAPMTPFWYRWPSWLTEFVAGLLLATFVQVVRFVGWGIGWRFALAVLLSWVYEMFLDQNRHELGHDAVKDTTQRAVGIIVGLLLWWRLT